MSTYQLPTGEEIEVDVNENIEEKTYSLKEPIIYNNVSEFDEDELKAAMQIEKDSIDNFDVKDEVLVQDVPEEDVRTAMTLAWAHVWKGFVKSRLCVRGYTHTQ